MAKAQAVSSHTLGTADISGQQGQEGGWAEVVAAVA